MQQHIDVVPPARKEPRAFVREGEVSSMRQWYYRGSVEQRVCIAVLVLGMLLRLREYLADRSLWLDELEISRNIVHRSYVGLLKPLAGFQAAPVGWLWLEHSAFRLFGDSEWALRLGPFLLSLGSLVVFYVVVRRWLTGLSAVLACAMFALSPDLIRYSVEVKQYGTDVFFVLLVLALTTRLHDQPSRNLTITWAGACVIAMWSSNAAIIVVAASTAVLLLLRLRSRQPSADVLGCSALFAVSLTVEYLVNLRAVARNPFLKDYWSSGIAPQRFKLGETLGWLWGALVHLAANPLRLAVAPVAWILVLLGSLLFVTRRGWTALLLLSPLPVAVLAGLLRQYPLRERLALYLAPLAFIGLAALAETRIPLRRNPVAIVGALLVLCVAFPLGRGLAVITTPIDVTDTRGPFAFAAAHWQPGDTLITGMYDYRAYEYYGTRYHLPRIAWFSVADPTRCHAPVPVTALRRYRRVWVVLTHHARIEPHNRTDLYYADFAQLVGPEGTTFHGNGDSAAAVFDVTRIPSRSSLISSNGQNVCILLH